MNPEETKYTCDQCLPGANNMATITNLSDNYFEMADAEYFGRYARFSPAGRIIAACRPSYRTSTDSPESNRSKRTIDDDNQVIITFLLLKTNVDN